MRLLNQNENFQADFGLVFRSSAIFAIFPEANLTVSLLNYWKIKNGISVSVVMSCRDVSGRLVSRELIEFDGDVINYQPPITAGSLEIEAFGSQNLRIPYAAIMGLYETPTSVSMVHSYGRNHSPSEIEEGRAILEVREACIGVKADQRVETVAFFHNGSIETVPQEGRLIITNAAGQEREWRYHLPSITPYETIAFDIEKLAPDLFAHLGDDDGWAALHFENKSSFPRMLVRWRHRDTGEVQVTHSNFDYSEFRTNALSEDAVGFMALPKLGDGICDCDIVIYPRCAHGTYAVEGPSGQSETQGGLVIPFDPGSGGQITVKRRDGRLPSRLVAALRGRVDDKALPFECSIGILHSERPPKRFHWAMVSTKFPTTLIIQHFSDLYGGPGALNLEFCLYGTRKGALRRVTRSFASLSALPAELPLTTIFPDAETLLGNTPGYITLFCEWGGLFLLTGLTSRKSMTVEHSF